MVNFNFFVFLQIMGLQMKFYNFSNGDVIQVDDIKIEIAVLNYLNFVIGY